jgi:Ca2+-transporting ATPase
MRDPGSGFFRNDITRNPNIWGALVLCAGLLILAVYLPGLAKALKIVAPHREGWALILGLSLLPFGIGQILRAWGGYRS